MQETDAAPGQLVILCDVFVPGHAKTKGSMEALGGGKMRDKPSSRVWRRLIAERVRGNALRYATSDHCAGREPLYDKPFEGRVGVRIVSYGQTATGQEGWLVKAMKWLIARAGFGDVDKLARNVLDALSCEDPDDAHLIADDSQVVDLYSHKRLAMPGMMVGQQITVWAIPEDAPW